MLKKNYQTMKLKDLGELNKIYNFQDTIILCEIFENCENLWISCVQRDKSKCCTPLPTDAEHVVVFERALIRDFTCVNTRLAFDTEILIDNNYNEKVLFDLHIDGKKETKRISIKVLKMD